MIDNKTVPSKPVTIPKLAITWTNLTTDFTESFQNLEGSLYASFPYYEQYEKYIYELRNTAIKMITDVEGQLWDDILTTDKWPVKNINEQIKHIITEVGAIKDRIDKQLKDVNQKGFRKYRELVQVKGVTKIAQTLREAIKCQSNGASQILLINKYANQIFNIVYLDVEKVLNEIKNQVEKMPNKRSAPKILRI